MNKLQSLIVKLFRIRSAPPAPAPKDQTGYRLNEWRRNESMVLASKALAKNPTWRLQMECLREEHPCHIVLALGVSPNDRIAMQARSEGYTMALANLEAFATPLKLTERLQATFETPKTK